MRTVNPEIIDVDPPTSGPSSKRLGWSARPRRVAQLTYGMCVACGPALILDCGCLWLLDQALHQGAWLAWPILFVLSIPALIATLIGGILAVVFLFAITVTLFGRDIAVSPRTVFKRPGRGPVKTVH